MEQIIFKPKYSRVLRALMLLYAAPWFFGLINAIIGDSGADWRLFWLLSSSTWLLFGLRRMREAMLKRIVFGNEITVEMYLRRPSSQGYGEPVRIADDAAIFGALRVQTRYLANAEELMQILVSLTGMEKLDVIYDEGGSKHASWSVKKDLMCLAVFVLYMPAMLWLHIRPFELIGPATDALLLGWAAALEALIVIKVIQAVKGKGRIDHMPGQSEDGSTEPPEDDGK